METQNGHLYQTLLHIGGPPWYLQLSLSHSIPRATTKLDKIKHVETCMLRTCRHTHYAHTDIYTMHIQTYMLHTYRHTCYARTDIHATHVQTYMLHTYRHTCYACTDKHTMHRQTRYAYTDRHLQVNDVSIQQKLHSSNWFTIYHHSTLEQKQSCTHITADMLNTVNSCNWAQPTAPCLSSTLFPLNFSRLFVPEIWANNDWLHYLDT